MSVNVCRSAPAREGGGKWRLKKNVPYNIQAVVITHYEMGTVMECGIRVLRYLFASALGSLFTLLILNARDGPQPHFSWSQEPIIVATHVGHPAPPPPAQHQHQQLKPDPVPIPKSSACIIKPQQPVIRNGLWQVFSAGKQEISIHGVYYDDRPDAAPMAVVRVFGVSSAPKNKTVLCQMWYKNYKDNPVLTTAVIASPGRGYRNKHKVQYKEYIYTCPVSKNDSLPENISLAFQPCQNSTIHKKISFAKKVVPKVQFGVCVATSFGRLNQTRLVEWVEMLELLGVGEINIYNSDISEESLKVLRHYQKQGLIVIHPCPPPIPEFTFWPRKLTVIPALNDCVYRNMYRYNYTIIKDLDEIIIPVTYSNYTAMVNGIRPFHKKLKKDPGLIVFRNAYFFLDFPKNVTRHLNKTQPNTTQIFYANSTMLSNLRRAAVSSPGYAVKSMFNPRTCVIAWNHFCMGRVAKTQVLNVDPKYALSHHYKKCHFKKAECAKVMNVSHIDPSILRFKDKLQKRLSNVHIS